MTCKAVESYRSAADAIGQIEHGSRLFCVLRGQWSMADAIHHVIEQVGPCQISIWPRTVAVARGDVIAGLMAAPNVIYARLVVQTSDIEKNRKLIDEWIGR